jgi:hypothetical protein
MLSFQGAATNFPFGEKDKPALSIGLEGLAVTMSCQDVEAHNATIPRPSLDNMIRPSGLRASSRTEN